MKRDNLRNWLPLLGLNQLTLHIASRRCKNCAQFLLSAARCAITEVEDGFLVSYYHSNGTGQYLNCTKIAKVSFGEIEA